MVVRRRRRAVRPRQTARGAPRAGAGAAKGSCREDWQHEEPACSIAVSGRHRQTCVCRSCVYTIKTATGAEPVRCRARQLPRPLSLSRFRLLLNFAAVPGKCRCLRHVATARQPRTEHTTQGKRRDQALTARPPRPSYRSTQQLECITAHHMRGDSVRRRRNVAARSEQACKQHRRSRTARMLASQDTRDIDRVAQARRKLISCWPGETVTGYSVKEG